MTGDRLCLSESHKRQATPLQVISTRSSIGPKSRRIFWRVIWASFSQAPRLVASGHTHIFRVWSPDRHGLLRKVPAEGQRQVQEAGGERSWRRWTESRDRSSTRVVVVLFVCVCLSFFLFEVLLCWRALAELQILVCTSTLTLQTFTPRPSHFPRTYLHVVLKAKHSSRVCGA